jgi:DNA gyrase subunit A
MVVRKKVDEVNPFLNDAKTVVGTPINDEVSKSFLEYTMAVVYSRALPDAIDGLKPVARRILFSMFRDGYTPDKNFVKSSRTVGNVMATLHPHGDSSIYDAMVKLAQPFYQNCRLVEGYGNWGDAGGARAAAPRYTESRLDKTALLTLSEIRENTVDMRPNYDGEDEEPVILPVQFPNLVINGTFGIAVGFSSNMAPHNPGEVLDATRWLLTHPTATLERLMDFIPGPDFPTGAQILGQDAIKEAYTTGKGIIRIRSTSRIEATGRGKHNIIFTEMPYGVKTEAIMVKVKEGIKNGKLQGIADIKDLTDRKNGIMLVVETKAGINPNALLGDLFKLTPLEDSFGINNVALVEGEPKTLGLKEQLEIFLAHRVSVVTRRTQFRKDKKNARLHLLEGMLKALANIDEVIKIIRGSADTAESKEKLIKKFKLDEIQAEYILSIQLRSLTKWDSIKLNEEKVNLIAEIVGLDKILNDEKELKAVIASELEAVKKQLDRPRRSVLVDGNIAEHIAAAKTAAASVSLEVADEECGVFLSAKGGIVRSPKLTSSKPVLSSMVGTTRGKFIAVTNKGRAFRIDTLHVGIKEAPVASVLPEKLATGEKVIAVTPVELPVGKTGGIAMGTKNGLVKIATPTWPVRSDDFTVIGLDGDDEVLSAQWVEDTEAYDFIFISTDTSFLSFPAKAVRPSGLSAGGVAGIKIAAEQSVSSFSVIAHADKASALVITHTGKTIKATPLSEFPQKGRATAGLRSHKLLKGETGLALSTVAANGVLFTAEGKEVPLPKIDSRRDGSGVPVKADELF